MKRNKHILINLTETQYKALLFISDKTLRKPSDAAYIMLLESLNKMLLQHVDQVSTDYQPLKYNNLDE